MGVAIPQLAPASQDRVSGSQVIDGSLKFDDGSSNFLKRTPSSDGNRRTWTWSAWVKRGNVSTTNTTLFSADGGGGTDFVTIRFEGNDLRVDTQGDGQSRVQVTTSAVYRDTGWYHIVVALDTTQGTAADRCKIYVNSTLQSTSNTLTQNKNFAINESVIHELGRRADGDDNPFDGFMSQVYLIDGQQLGPENFGFTDSLTNTWKPKKFDSFNNPNNVTTWSDLTTASSGAFEGSLPKTNLFDGIASNANRANLNTVGASIDIDFSSNPINVKNTISIWSGKASLSYSINGGAYVTYSDAQEAYKDIPFTGTLTSLSLKKSDEGAGASAIKIDGYILLDGKTDNSFYLPFDGNSPIGENKSGIVSINDGRTWSATATISSGGAASNKGLSNGFDGSVATAFEGDTSGATVTVPVSATISAGGVRVYAAVTSGNPLVVLLKNGGTTVETINGAISGGRWYASSSYAGAITSLVISRTGRAPEFNGIEIGGVTLIDNVVGNNWTPVNFGGSVSLEKATGALPILNTTQGGTNAGVGNFGSNVSKVIAVTVSNASGSNKYYFDSVLNPTLPLIRGSIISFDTSDSSNNSHPFKLSSTNADSSGGTEYTDGVSYFVNGSQKNASDYVSQYSSHSSGFRGIKWTVPHDVSTTYYYCTSHTGMGNNGRLNSTTDVTKADPFAWKCFLALPLNDPSIDKSSTLNRTSSGKAITVSGCVSSSDQRNFYGRSTFFDGSNDQLSVEAHGQMAFGADDDWTIEVWFYTTTVGSGWAISDYSGNTSSSGDPGGQIYFSASSGAGLHWYQNSTRLAEIPKEEIQANKWHHLAFVKDGTADIITSFLDGVIKTTSPLDDTSGSSTGGLIIGQQGGGSRFSGYMSDFRVYKGIKKYTNNFIPASTDPDILPDTPSGVSGGSKLTKITEGAVSF